MPMPRTAAILSLCAVLGVLACASRTEVAFDRNAEFARFHTWSWQPKDAAKVEAPDGSPEALAARATQLIAGSLAARGFERRDRDPDFVVRFHLTLLPRIERVVEARAPQMITGHDDRGAYWIESSELVERPYHEFSLHIEVIRRDGRLVWKGATRERLQRGERPEMKRAIEKLLERLPPPRSPHPGEIDADQVAWLRN